MTILWVNTVISILGILFGIFLASGSIISIANMPVSWTGALLVAAILVPVMFLVSGLGAWGVYVFDHLEWINYLIGLPWVYLLLFVAAMLMTFKLI